MCLLEMDISFVSISTRSISVLTIIKRHVLVQIHISIYNDGEDQGIILMRGVHCSFILQFEEKMNILTGK